MRVRSLAVPLGLILMLSSFCGCCVPPVKGTQVDTGAYEVFMSTFYPFYGKIGYAVVNQGATKEYWFLDRDYPVRLDRGNELIIELINEGPFTGSTYAEAKAFLEGARGGRAIESRYNRRFTVTKSHAAVQ